MWKNKSLGTVEGFHLYQWRTLILVLKSQDLSMPLVVQLPKNLVSSFLEITSRWLCLQSLGPQFKCLGQIQWKERLTGWPDEIELSQWCPPPPLRATITILIIILLITQTTLFESWDPSTLGLHWLHHLSKPQTTRWFQAGCEDLDAHHWQWQGNSQIQQFGAQKCAFC